MKMKPKAIFVFHAMLLASYCCCADTAPAQTTIQILATTDTHGRFYPFNYMLNVADEAGSLAQTGNLAEQLRTEYPGNTIVVDNGDFSQDNLENVFIGSANPMIAAMNGTDYALVNIGNHEFNHGVENLTNMMSQFHNQQRVLCANVYGPDGDRLFSRSTIVTTACGATVGFIGSVTPNITRWDAANLKDYKVTDPAQETREAIAEIKDSCDLLVAIAHMGEPNEYDKSNSGVKDLAAACPELDLIICGHTHENKGADWFYDGTIYQGTNVTDTIREQGILIVEPYKWARALGRILITLTPENDTFVLNTRSTDLVSSNILIQTPERTIPPSPELITLLKPFSDKAKHYAGKVIGTLTGGPLAPPNSLSNVPSAYLQPTALLQLINSAEAYYGQQLAGKEPIKVQATSLLSATANMQPGPIHYYDIANLYRYENTLYVLRMTGAQLRKYMEWSVGFFQQLKPGDLTIAFNPKHFAYNYDVFNGVSYTIALQQPTGHRIKNLSWPNGTPVDDNDTFLIAVNNYRANAFLLAPGPIFSSEETLPVKVAASDEAESFQNGTIRDMLIDYISTVKKGSIDNALTNNWHIDTGWNETNHNLAVKALQDGSVFLGTSDLKQSNLPVQSVTLDMLRKAGLLNSTP